MAGFLDALRGFFNPPPGFEPEQRALSAAQIFGHDLDDDYPGNTANERVTVESAMRNIAVQSAVRLLANDIGSLPVDAFRSQEQGKKELRKPGWVIEPNPLNPNATWEDHVKQVVYSLLTDGNAFTYCFPSVTDVQAIRALDPLSVDVQGGQGFGEVTYRIPGVGTLTPNEVIHVPWMIPAGKNRGLDPITTAQQGLAIAIAADKFVGAYFGNGATIPGVVEVPIGSDLTEAQAVDLVKGLNKKHRGASNAHAIGALTGGATLKQYEYNNRDAQLLELRDSIVEDVARLFGIPPHMLGSQKPGAVGYASVEQRSIDYVTHAVLPIVKRIEVGYSRLLRGQQTYLRFNVEGLKRGDQNARALFYTALLQNKVIRRDEVRALEDLPFDPEAAGYLETPNNNPPQEPAPEATPAPDAEPAADQGDRGQHTHIHLPDNLQVEMQPTPPPVVNVRVEPTPVTVNMPEQPPPVVNVAAPVVNVAPAEVTFVAPKPTRKRIIRNEAGDIVGIE